MSVSTAQAIDLQGETSERIDAGYNPKLPPKLAGSLETKYDRHIPIGGVTTERIDWEIPEASPSSGGWISLKDSYIQLRLAIRKRGTLVADPPTSDKVTAIGFNPRSVYEYSTPETAFVHALWREIRTRLGSVDVSDDDAGYSWWSNFVRDAIVEEPEFGKSDCKTAIIAGSAHAVANNPAALTDLWHQHSDLQTSGYQSMTVYAGSATDAINIPRSSRTRMTLLWRVCDNKSGHNATDPGAATVEVIMKPKSGIWNTQYLIPPNTSLSFHLQKNPDRFCFRSVRDVKEIEPYIDWTQSTAALFLCRKYPERAVAEALAAESLTAAFQYPFVRSRTHISTHEAADPVVDIIGLLAGPRPALVVIGVLDNYSLNKPLIGDNGGAQFSLYQCSGAARPERASTVVNSLEEYSAPPLVTSLQVTWGSRVVPLIAYRQPTSMEVARAYEDYRRVSNGALSYGDFVGSYSLYCLDLTDSGTAKETMAGRFSDMGDGDRGSLGVRLEVAKNESPDVASPGRRYTVMVTGFATAVAEISPALGTVRRKGF